MCCCFWGEWVGLVFALTTASLITWKGLIWNCETGKGTNRMQQVNWNTATPYNWGKVRRLCNTSSHALLRYTKVTFFTRLVSFTVPNACYTSCQVYGAIRVWDWNWRTNNDIVKKHVICGLRAKGNMSRGFPDNVFFYDCLSAIPNEINTVKSNKLCQRGYPSTLSEGLPRYNKSRIRKS